MKLKLPLLVGTHLLALGIAWSAARNMSSATEGKKTEAGPSRSKSVARDRDNPNGGDGAQLLAGFMAEDSPVKNASRARYEELKATLAEADDPKAALAQAIRAYHGLDPSADGNGKEKDRAELLAEMEVRALQWLQRDPMAATEFFTNDFLGQAIAGLMDRNVLPDVIAATGVMKSFPWATKVENFMPSLLGAACGEIKTGGFALLQTFMAALQESDPKGNYRETEVPDKGDFLYVAGGSVPLADKDKLLAYASSLDFHDRVRLLDGFVRSSPQAAAWMMDLIKNGQVAPDLAAQMKGPLGNAVIGAAELDIEQRIAARRGTENNGNKPREEILKELMRGDVGKLLETGRDWRYEFRTGTATAEQVLAAVRESLPSIPPEGENEVISAIYHHLAEENPGRAQALLDLLPENQRRARQFLDTWQNYVGLDPDVFLDSMKYLPEPVTAEEKDFRTKGWNWKARGFLDRFGDDYVDWVKQMPAGIDKDTAMNSLIWATRERNPAKADELSKQLYPKKP